MGRIDEPPSSCKPAAGRQDGTSHDPDRPKVGVGAALVAEPVGRPSLSEQLVEGDAVLGGYRVADLSGPALQVARRGCVDTLQGHPDCSDDELGKFLHGRLAHILTVNRPVGDSVDVGGSECPDLARKCAKRGHYLARLSCGGEQLGRRSALPESADEPLKFLIGAERVRIRSLEQAKQLGGCAAGPLLRAHEKVAHRHERGHIEEVVDIRRLDLVLAASIEVLQSQVVSRVSGSILSSARWVRIAAGLTSWSQRWRSSRHSLRSNTVALVERRRRISG
jgi:hypothetical protein